MSPHSAAPDGTPHYSGDPNHPLYFYRGWASNFDIKYPLYVAPPILPPTDAWLDVPLFYASGEHWLHCNKARTWAEHERIRKAHSPFMAKEYGSAKELPMTASEVKLWDARRYQVMVTGLRAKTAQHTAIQRLLLATGNRLIAEDSPTDFIWGIRSSGGGMEGLNLLGKAWMRVRSDLEALRDERRR